MSGEIAVLFYDERRQRFRWQYGSETYYNERREMIEFETLFSAMEWIEKEHPEMVTRLPEGMQFKLLGADDDKQIR